MNSNLKLKTLGAFCAVLVLFCGSVSASPSSGVGKMAVDVMPEGCGNPYQDVASFVAFYDLTIETIAAKRGPSAKGVADLFAVSEMKKATDSLLVNPQEESPVDRLIAKQLCQFQKIQTAAKLQGKTKEDPTQISSENPELHEHLVMIAPKLYRDTRALAVEILSARAKAKQKENILEQKWLEVRKAREEGRAKIRDLFD